jgi:uncharacterized circularly permuted ATP-grasp superfamily protein
VTNYDYLSFYDEYLDAKGEPRPGVAPLLNQLKNSSFEELKQRQESAEILLMQQGITFQVYGDSKGAEKTMPLDILPRIISGAEFEKIQKGLQQRVTALNLFLQDVYGDQRILQDGLIPVEVIRSAKSFRHECVDLKPPGGIWCHINGVDLVRDSDGTMMVLEDNLRCPSGVSYLLENREILKRTFPQIFSGTAIRPVSEYPSRLLSLLESLTPRPGEPVSVAVLTPGPANSAYFEHSFLAREMGARLVEGRDLMVRDGKVMLKTTKGLSPVDVIYRRIDDDFLDPHTFREDSMIGVPGLMEVYREGGVAIANAPGTGIADDKVVYAYVPEMIKFYLGEEPLIPNVPTYLCWRDSDRDHVLKNLENLVVKAANEAGGYGMLIGPASTAEQREQFAARIKADPRGYIAQPVLGLSRVPVVTESGVASRHVDLRPYVLMSPNDIWVVPGGLTRVAMVPGSLVVNSSQGGGSKDTWVVDL